MAIEFPWKLLWKSNAHPRTSNFVWRLISLSLPTRKNLQRRGLIAQLYTHCVGKEKRQSFTSSGTAHGLNSSGSHQRSILELRNKILFEDRLLNPEVAAEMASARSLEYSDAKSTPPRLPSSNPPGSNSRSRWDALPPPFYKLNFDAGCMNSGSRGAGAVIRNEEGIIMMAALWRIPSNLPIPDTEATTCLLGLKMAQEGCFLDFIVEGDNIQVISGLKGMKYSQKFFWSHLR
ncbi:hypothetical protein PIB30_037553 [Stylosanthes scabra]|uniref:RNase H type-1 domain-containing protein n=1 Tax=Stylosanthes scabra TaxID=79078 RepID=A0ABU6SF11_9FABA|nr:hypothetical protein [Stylosanthes scabra]